MASHTMRSLTSDDSVRDLARLAAVWLAYWPIERIAMRGYRLPEESYEQVFIFAALVED